jgi:transposase
MTELSQFKSLVPTAEEMPALHQALAQGLSAELAQRIGSILELLPQLVQLLERNDLSLEKLRQQLFGLKTESTRNLCGAPPKDKPKPTRRQGHGRRGHRQYTGARRVHVAHATLRSGARCPDCQKGKVRPQPQPAVTVEITAQPPVQAIIHELERLRCDVCGKVFTAAAPPEVKPEKYDASVGVLVGVLRYGSGLPFYRLEKLQQTLGVPLPASVQYEQASQCATALEPILDHLIYLGAQAAVFYNDDTKMRVGQLRQEIQADTQSERTGIFTSGIVCEGLAHPIRLVFTGRQHAGENLADVLAQRQSGLPAPFHMCDGLSRNDPKGHQVVPCNCVVHARRNFVEIHGAFPEQCQKVVTSFAGIYRIEAQAKHLSPDQRQRLHQEHSQPVLDELKQWFAEQTDTRQIEPNSGFGQAMNYLLKRWDPLTRFLREPGAPLDNNVTERLLKTSILHRKNSLHYRTVRGAHVGDLFMSLIQTCHANGVNPFDYLLAAVRHAKAVAANPAAWLPWNYPQAMPAG